MTKAALTAYTQQTGRTYVTETDATRWGMEQAMRAIHIAETCMSGHLSEVRLRAQLARGAVQGISGEQAKLVRFNARYAMSLVA